MLTGINSALGDLHFEHILHRVEPLILPEPAGGWLMLLAGVPLYPVDMMRSSRTRMAPTRFPRQSALDRTAMAMRM